MKLETHAERPASDVPRIKRRGLTQNAVANTAANVTYFAVTFLLTPIAVDRLGPGGWGIWQLVGATSAYALLLNLGLGSAVHYQVSYHTARGDFERLSSAITNVRIYLSGAALLILVAFTIGGHALTASLVAPAQVDLAYDALALALAITCFGLPFQFFTSVLAGLQRYDLYGVFQASSALLLFAGVLSGFHLGMQLRGFVLLMSLGSVLPAFASWIAAKRLLPAESLRFRRVDLPYFKQMIQYSLSTLAFTGGTVALYQSMRFIASWRCGGVEAAGRIGLVINIVQVLAVVFTPVFGVLLSRVGQLHGEGRLDEIARLLMRALAAVGLLVVPSVAFLGVAAHGIFEAWVGRSLDARTLDQLAATARLMLVGQGAYALALPCYFTLLGLGEHRVFGLSMLAVGAANAAVGWIAAGFVPRLETLGLVFGLLMLLLTLGVTVPSAVARFSLDPVALAVRTVVVPLIASVPGALVVLLRPRIGAAIPDLAIDMVAFGLCCLPGLEVARRRFVSVATTRPVTLSEEA